MLTYKQTHMADFIYFNTEQEYIQYFLKTFNDFANIKYRKSGSNLNSISSIFVVFSALNLMQYFKAGN